MDTAVLLNRRRTDSCVFHCLLKVLAFSFFLGYLLITYWLFWPYTPIVCDKINILNDGKVVVVGDILWYQADIDKKTDQSSIIYHQLLNDFVIDYSPSTGTLPKGKRTITYPLEIPKYAQPGEYKLKWEGHYQVNPIREVTVIVWSEPFQIVAAEN